jgi:transcriptional regulator NrdR family protein
MKCLNPRCDYSKTKVINTKEKLAGKLTLRRRLCPKCHLRYTSVEIFSYFGYPNNKKRQLLKKLTQLTSL